MGNSPDASASQAAPSGKEREEDLIIIDTDDPDDSLIIIEDDDGKSGDLLSPVQPAIAPPGDLGSQLFDFFNHSTRLSAEAFLRPSLHPLLAQHHDAWRALLQGRILFDVKPQSFWTAHVDLWARGLARSAWPALDIDLAQPLALDAPGLYDLRPEAALGELYLRLSGAMGSLSLGRQRFQWSRSDLAQFADLINPVDQRAGLLLPEGGDGRLPVWSIAGRLLLGRVALRAIFVPIFQSPHSALWASEARALDPLAASPAWLDSDQSWQMPGLARSLREVEQLNRSPASDLSTAEMALRATGSAGGVDLGAQIFWGHDRTPWIVANDDWAQILAAANDARVDAARQTMQAACPTDSERQSCLPSASDLSLIYTRSLVGQIDGATTVGPALINLQFSATPLGGSLPGAVVPIIDLDNGRLTTQRLSRLNAALALESGYGEWVQASVELIDQAYLNVPSGHRVAQVEPVDSDSTFRRTVHRFAVAMRVQGRLLDSRLLWHLGALSSPVQRDFFVAPRLSYKWVHGQELSLGAELLGGPPGSQGGFYSSASRLYMQWGLQL